MRCGAAAASAAAVEPAVVVGAGANAGLSAGAVRVGLTTNTVPVQDRPQNNNGQRIVVAQLQQCNVHNKTWSSDNHHDVDESHVDDENDTGGRCAKNGDDAVGSTTTAPAAVDSKYKNVDNMETVGAGATASVADMVRNFGKVDNVTSNASLERCSNIRKLLEEQHRKWWRNQLHGQQEWWADEDSYNLTAFNQINGIWPLGHPLPLPDWVAACDDEHTKGTLHFDSVWEYEDLNAIIETKLHRMLEETHYDTINLFVDFYRAFKRTRRSDLKSFFQFYDLPINRRHHMCVSLAMEIMTRIIEIFPVLQHYLYLVSCEEQVMSQSDYIESTDEVGGLNSPHANVEKEHAMVAMKITIAGREGVMILDPGYHIGRAVTVMSDQMYPHTGWFTQSKETHLQRDYCYNYCLHSNKYVEWMERETRGDEQSFKSSLIYIEQPYVTAIDVTVRRNLVYNFRSLLSRDAKGRVFAGIYLPVVPNSNESHFTIFYDGPNDQRIKVKFMFNVFKNPTKVPDNVQQHLNKVAPQLNMNAKELTDLCKSLAEVVNDQDFVRQLLGINEDIGIMSAEN